MSRHEKGKIAKKERKREENGAKMKKCVAPTIFEEGGAHHMEECRPPQGIKKGGARHKAWEYGSHYT